MSTIQIYNWMKEINASNFIKKIDTNATNFILLCLHPVYFKKIFKTTLYIDTLEISTNDINVFKGIKKQKGFTPTKEQITILKKDLLSFLPCDPDFKKHWEVIINSFPFTTIVVQEIIYNDTDTDLETNGDSYKIVTGRREAIIINDCFKSSNTKIIKSISAEIVVQPSAILTAALSLLKSFPEKNHYTEFFTEVLKNEPSKTK